MALKADLMNHDWQDVYVDNTNQSYDAYLDTFLLYYDHHCPLKEYRQNPKKKRKPWFTEGLEKACKKKNRLYREFITYHIEQRKGRTSTKNIKTN